MIPIYASGDFTAGWNGKDLSSGWGDDQFLTVTPNGPLKETMIGADGHMSVSKLADLGGVITMTFKQTAQALKDIDEVAAIEMAIGDAAQLPFAGEFHFKDPTGNMQNFVALNVVLVDRGTIEHQKVMGERTITWNAETIIFSNPASIKSAVDSFLK